MSKKKPYYPNNWKAIKDAPHQFFIPIPFDEFMDWKMEGWELPSSIECIVREQDMKTGKVKEYVYSKIGNANKRCAKIMKEGKSEFTVCTHDELAHMFPHDKIKEDSIYEHGDFIDDRFGNTEEDD
tara:strand:- start:1742 stop:2119 length:378 start_codon:yes stop_codon:yes gene_type:complete